MRSTFITKYIAWLKELSEDKKAREVVPAPSAAPLETAPAPSPDSGVERATAPVPGPVAQTTATAPESGIELAAVPESAVKQETKAAHEPAPDAETMPAPVLEAVPGQETELEPESQPEVVEAKPFGTWEAPPAVREKPEDVLFQDFPLDPRILRAVLEDLQFKVCTPIQGMVLPHALAGEDMAGKAQTGTGKTAAFLITMLQRFLTQPHDGRNPNQPYALALAPTRELAIQIAHDANALCAYCHFHTVAVYGGMDYDRQKRLLQNNVDFVVATPGRLIDYLNNHVLNLDRVEVLVIDEADRMLDMGFIPDVKRIIYRLGEPEVRQTMLFSATLNHDIMNLAARWMRPNPVVLEAEPEHIVAEGVEETIYAVTAAEKMPIVLWTLKHEDCHRVLIFRNRRRDVEELHSELLRWGVASEMLDGDVDQKKRLRILEDFRVGKVKVIIATDVAARGIHVDDITHVFNYDFPFEAEDYVHRVGRTGRAGHRGCAISFADEESAFVVPDIEKYIGRPLPITYPAEEMLQWPEDTAPLSTSESGSSAPPPHKPHGSSRGGRRPPQRGHAGHRSFHGKR